MTLKPYVIGQFGGLNLVADSFAVGSTGATSVSNIALDVPGEIRTRDGYESFATTTTAPLNLHVFNAFTASNSHIITSSATKLEAFQQTTGAAVASGTVTPGVGPHVMTTFGTSSASVVYATSIIDTGTGIRKWSGSAWSVVAGTSAYVARGITATRASNRLVLGSINNFESRVQFSDVGDPETFTSTSFVDLMPGDGEVVQQVVAWQDLIFAFKRTKFFVFYGESTDANGKPVFNYRAVIGAGSLDGTASVAVAPHGVYFIGHDGIYLTTGGPPVRVDGPLSPLFSSGSSALNFSGTQNCLAWHRNRLICVLGPASSSTVYVYYADTGQWTQWSMMATKNGGPFRGYVAPASTTPATSLLFVNGTDSAVYRMAPNLTTDAGSAISWSYTLGRYEVAAGNEATIPETSLVGSGTVTLAIASDLSDAGVVSPASASATLGTAPAVAEGWPNPVDAQGTYFQAALSGSGAAVVTEMRHHVSFVRQTSNAR